MSIPVKISGENAIKEATITIFLSNPIIKPERFKDLINQEKLNNFFQSFQKLGEFNANIAIKQGKVSANEPILKDDAGFKLLKFENGLPVFVVQGLNNINRTFFSFHNLNYTRWNEFLEQFILLLESILGIQKEIFINGLGLHYIDEFIWDSDKEIDLSTIMTAQDYFPKNFIKVKNGQLINTRECDTQENYKLLDRLQVDVNSSIIKSIKISHNQTALLKELVEFGSEQSKNQLRDILKKLHADNKSFLQDILSKETQKLIKLID